MGILADLLGDIAGDLYGNIPSEVKEVYTQTLPSIDPVSISFQPFTVMGPSAGVVSGGSYTDPDTGQPVQGTSFQLGTEQEAIRSALELAAKTALTSTTSPLPRLAESNLETLGLTGIQKGASLIGQAYPGTADLQLARARNYALGRELLGAAGTPFDSGIAEREQEVYNRIRGLQTPDEERQRLALEERLANQGRLGVQTSMFGGTPEAFALAKAQAEARNQAAFAATEQAQQEQLRRAELGRAFQEAGIGSARAEQELAGGQFGLGFQAATGGLGALQAIQDAYSQREQRGIQSLQSSYLPQAAQLSMLSPAINIASLQDVARRQAGEYALEADLANLNALIGQKTGLANLYSGMFGGAGGLLSAGANSALSLLDILFGD